MSSVPITLFERRLIINAPPSVVFDLLSTADGLRKWIARDAEVDRVERGRIEWTHDDGARMLGRFVVIQRPHRLVFSYGWADGALGVPPESTTVEITLTERDGATELHLLHRNLPAKTSQEHAAGWRHFLGRLQDVAAHTKGS